MLYRHLPSGKFTHVYFLPTYIQFLTAMQKSLTFVLSLFSNLTRVIVHLMASMTGAVGMFPAVSTFHQPQPGKSKHFLAVVTLTSFQQLRVKHTSRPFCVRLRPQPQKSFPSKVEERCPSTRSASIWRDTRTGVLQQLGSPS